MADASHRHQAVASMMILEWKDLEILSSCEIRSSSPESSSLMVLTNIEVRPSIFDRIAEAQKQDSDIIYFRQSCNDIGRSEKLIGFDIDSHKCVHRRGRLITPDVGNLRVDIMEDCHRSRYTIHPSSSKMYADMKRMYYWEGMKRDIAMFVKRCLICQ